MTSPAIRWINSPVAPATGGDEVEDEVAAAIGDAREHGILSVAGLRQSTPRPHVGAGIRFGCRHPAGELG
ncbi:MAG: hypothetical protein J0L88_01910 [Xanthomonadales bacterium]|nr:hypothetical protein [Xanthomonadales bacterium]